MKVLALPLVPPPPPAPPPPLPPPLRTQIAAHRWHRGCPVPLSQLRVLTVSYWGFDGRTRSGQLVVNQAAAAPLLGVFRRLYGLHFAIRRIPYLDRSRLRKGMVTPAVVAAFRSIGWGWGGFWTGTKDYMHFSSNGHQIIGRCGGS